MGKLNMNAMNQELMEDTDEMLPVVATVAPLAQPLNPLMERSIEPGIISEIGGAGTDVALAAACPPLAIVSIAVKAVTEIVPAVCNTIQTVTVAKETTRQVESIAKQRIRLAEEETNRTTVEETEKTRRTFIEAAERIKAKEIELKEFEMEMQQKQYEIRTNRDSYLDALARLDKMIEEGLDTVRTLKKAGVVENFEKIHTSMQTLIQLSNSVEVAYKQYPTQKNGGET